MIRRIVSAFLVIVMLFSLVTVSVFAADGEELASAVPEVTEPVPEELGEESGEELGEGLGEESGEELEEELAEALTMGLAEEPAALEAQPPAPFETTLDVYFECAGLNFDCGTTLPVEYSDAHFTGSNDFDFDLAKLSFFMGWATYAHNVIWDVLGQEGFTEQYQFRYPKSGTEDKVSYTLAQKTLPDGTPLVAVAVRGVGYSGEWVSNFHIYDSSNPDVSCGFYRSAEFLVYGDEATDSESLIEYLDDHNIDPAKAKIWVFGYSRGAAVANCVGALINADERFDASHLFDYAFACPCTVRESAAYIGSGIYSIISEMDPVAGVPPREWGFTRFGVTYALPNRSLMGSGFDTRAARAKAAFSDLMSEYGAPVPELRMLDSQELLLEELTGLLTSMIPTPEDYGAAGQDTLMNLLYSMRVEETDLDLADLIEYLFRNRDFCAALTNVLTDLEGLSRGVIPDGARLQKELDTLKDLTIHLGGIGSVPLVRLSEYVTDFAARLFVNGSRVRSAKELTKLTESKEYLFLIYIGDLLTCILNDRANESAVLLHHWQEVYYAWLMTGDENDTLFTPRRITARPVTVGEKLAARTEATIAAVNEAVHASVSVVAKTVMTAAKVQCALTSAVVKTTANALRRLLPF